MPQISQEVDDATARLLENLLSRMERSINNSNQIPRMDALPARISIGKVYYFNQAIAATAITGEGYWGYKSTGWVLIA